MGQKIRLVSALGLSNYRLADAVAAHKAMCERRGVVMDPRLDADWVRQPPWRDLAPFEGDASFAKALGRVVFDFFGEATSRTDPPFAETQPLLPLTEEALLKAKSVNVELVLLADGADPQHVGRAALIEAWVELMFPPGRDANGEPLSNVHLTFDVRHVGVDPSALRIFSVLDEINTTRKLGEPVSPVIDYAAAEQVFVLQAVEALQPASGTDVYINGISGSSVAKSLLQQAAELVSAESQSGGVHTVEPGSDRRGSQVIGISHSVGLTHSQRTYFPLSLPLNLSHSAINHRFSRAVTLVNSTGTVQGGVVEHSIRAERLEAFVTGPVGNRRLSELGWKMVQAAEYHDGRPISACAQLLSQVDPDGLASRLNSQVRHWHQLRLWSKNLAPEMVLHDEAHSQAVDRHVASLAAHLLTANRLQPIEVYLLALAAWLHDWGHASAGQLSDAVSHPREVRDLHGLLTRKRLRDEQLSTHHGLNDVESVWTALLSAHHQGWTSCDTKAPGSPQDAEPWVAGRDTTSSDDPIKVWAERKTNRSAAANAALEPARSFASEVQRFKTTLQKAWQTPPVDLLAKAQQMLAILRIADAADIGRHRVPHLGGLTGSGMDSWRAASALGLASLQLEPKASDAYRRIFNPAAVTALFKAGSETSSKAQGEDRPATTDPAEPTITAQARREAFLNIHGQFESEVASIAATFPADLGEKIIEVFERDLSYLAHLIKQEEYFLKHNAVSGVYLTIQTADTDGVASLVPLVRASSPDNATKALETVDADVQRECGITDLAKEPQESLRSGVLLSLQLMNLELRSAQLLVRTGDDGMKA